MKCPSCSSKISFTKCNKRIQCQHCKSELISENYTPLMVWLVIMWFLILMPIMVLTFDASFFGLLLEFAIAILAYYLVVSKLVTYKVIDAK